VFSSGNHPDFRVVRPEGEKVKIEQIREVCHDTAYLPYLSQRKVYFFTSLDKLTEVAANAFLKTLEEPPKGVVFLALALGEDRVLPTILSRMQRFYVSLPEAGAEEEGEETEDAEPTMIEEFTGWHSILDLFRLAEYWEKKDRALIDRHLLNLCSDFRQRMLAEPNNLVYLRIINEIGEARNHLAANVNTRLLLEDLYLRIYEASSTGARSGEDPDRGEEYFRGYVVKMRSEP
jgi:DNA polymerase-3 subunit delta'